MVFGLVRRAAGLAVATSSSFRWQSLVCKVCAGRIEEYGRAMDTVVLKL